MTIIPMLTRQYAVCVYVHGTRRFDTVVTDYHEPVKQYAADNYTLEQIDSAFVKGYISETEYQNTIAYTQKVEVQTE